MERAIAGTSSKMQQGNMCIVGYRKRYISNNFLEPYILEVGNHKETDVYITKSTINL